MNTPHPYEEKRFDNGLILREFKHNANVDDLIWHQDKKDRKVFVVESSGWKLQLSSGLPFPLIEGKEYFIPKKSWHRVIKGNGNLKIEIHERDDKMQIAESQLRQHVRLLLKEEVYGTIATVYHGSLQPPEEFLKLFETGDGSSYASTLWKPGKGAGSMYGHGIYSVWMKTDHKTFKGDYGEWIYKLKVNLHGFIIFDEAICQKVYGKSISPLEQLKLLGKEQELKLASKKEIKILSTPPIKDTRSADLARDSSKFLRGRVNGLVFFGSNDGPVVLIYDPDVVTPIAWTKLDKTTKELGHWTSWNASEIKHSLSRASHSGTQTDTKRLQSPEADLDRILNNVSLLNNLSFLNVVYNKLSEEQKIMIVKGTKNEDVLMKFIDDASDNVRLNVLRNSKSSSKNFAKLSGDESKRVRVYIAKNNKTEPQILNKLAGDKESGVRLTVAANSNTPEKALTQLAGDKDANVRVNVAANSNTPEKALTQLAGDKDRYILVQVANNKNTSTKIFAQLVAGEDKYIKKIIGQNPSVPVEILAQLATDEEQGIRSYVASNSSAPAELLTQLAEDEYEWTRRYVAQNKNTPLEVLKKLSKDNIEDIRYIASFRLKELKIMNELKSLVNQLIFN